jgi:hypothetical protein
MMFPAEVERSIPAEVFFSFLYFILLRLIAECIRAQWEPLNPLGCGLMSILRFGAEFSP